MKAIIWIIVILAVIGLAWWWLMGNNRSGSVVVGTAAPMTAANGVAPESAIVSTGTSNSDLDQDMSNIDAQLGGLSSDSASVNASVASSSQPGQ